MSAAITSFIAFTLFACYSCESSDGGGHTYKFFPTFHLGPLISPITKVGWMNDPNGFCLFNGEYHLFYQYNPNSSLVPGIAYWGHAKSNDLVHWEHLPIALYPDRWYDKDGVFSGSAIVENGVMYIYYTGNVNHPGQSPDHEQHQILVTSNDGLTFTKSEEPIIIGANRQPNFRDPKVWKHNDTYYMVLGNSFNNNTLGRVLLYASKDKVNWEEVSIIAESDGFLGYMWECPDFFEIYPGVFVLLMSPQGMLPKGDKYRNLYQCGYILGRFDYESHLFTQIQSFRELDHGSDVYATQTMIDKHGDRVLIAWFDMWDENYPEGPDGFTGQMTIPRKLSLSSDGGLVQKPIQEMELAVGRKLHAGLARGGTEVKLEKNTGKVEIHASRRKNFKLIIKSGSGNGTVTLSYNYKSGRVTLDRGGPDAVRRTKYRPVGDLHILIYIDSSSIEAFFGCGEMTMSSRFFLEGPLTVCVDQDSHADLMFVNEMKRTVPIPHPE